MNIYFLNIYLEMKVLAIGDPHFMITNIKNVEIFMEKFIEIEEKVLISSLNYIRHQRSRSKL